MTGAQSTCHASYPRREHSAVFRREKCCSRIRGQGFSHWWSISALVLTACTRRQRSPCPGATQPAPAAPTIGAGLPLLRSRPHPPRRRLPQPVPTTPAGGEIKNPDTFTLLLSGDVATLDPQWQFDGASNQVAMKIYEKLIDFKGDSLTEYEPVLATEIPSEQNGLITKRCRRLNGDRFPHPRGRQVP